MEGMKMIVRKTTFFAVVLAALIAVLPPFFYFLLGYQYLSAVLETEAEMNGLLVTQIISASPEYWRYQHLKLEEFLSTNTIKRHDETRRILDSGGVVIAKSEHESTRPIITRSHSLYDSGNVVGRIEIGRPLRPLMVDTLIAALISLILGAAVYATLKIFPLRALAQTLEALHIEKRRAEENADEVRKLNEGLELKVEERTKQLLEAREELVRNEKLSILGQLAGSVGHELRNPLGVMNNAIYFLKTVLPDSDETVQEYLNMIKSEIDNSERIISDLLDFSRTKTPQIKSTAVSELISKSLGICTVPENVKIETKIPETLPLLKIDPFQMTQVFQNLITNACQAMPKGGELYIRARQVLSSNLKPETLNLIPDADFVEISVTDTGDGVAPENMRELFRPLFTTKPKGIGLGLVVSKRLTEGNGGRIDVASEPGNGTTFTVLLPYERL